MDVCLDYMKKKETEISDEMSSKVKEELDIEREFIKAMLKLTNCPALIQFLALWTAKSESNTNFILELSDLINFENLYVEHKELFINLMKAMNSSTTTVRGLKHILDIQQNALMM